jgi:hypothetical protein
MIRGTLLSNKVDDEEKNREVEACLISSIRLIIINILTHAVTAVDIR